MDNTTTNVQGREIKFRVWNGYKMVYDICVMAGKQWDLLGDRPIEGYPIMQFTGLRDKSGKEIYEGDVINVGFFALNDTDKFGKECWKNLPAGVDANDISTITDTIKVTFHPKDIYWLYRTINDNPDVVGVEVIGNIYESKPEGIIAEGLIDHGDGE